MTDLQQKFQSKFPTGLINESLSKYSTFQIGGPADYFYKLKDLKDLSALIKFTQEQSIPFTIIGAGSNILFHEEGYRGLIIRMEAKSIEINGTEITADAGTMISQLIKTSVKADLTGLEQWTGLPGTVGGAVRGNAGCNGLETIQVLKSATLLDPKTGKIEEKPNSYFNFQYRHSILKETKEIVLKATFQLKKRQISKEEQQAIIDKCRNFRMTKQPFGSTTGSFFKNPSPDKPAGMLIDQAGLKGYTISKAQISTVHANFFLNTGGATYKDMLALVNHAKEQVKAKFGIELEEEVQIIPPN